MTDNGFQGVIAASQPGEPDADRAVAGQRDNLLGNWVSGDGGAAFQGFAFFRQHAVELERQLRLGTGDLVQQRLERNQPGGGDQGRLRRGAFARPFADGLQLDIGKMDFAAHVGGVHGDAVLVVLGGHQSERTFVQSPLGIRGELGDARRGKPAAVVDDQAARAALEALGLDVRAEFVGFAGHQRQALLAQAGRARHAAVSLQHDGGHLPVGPSDAVIEHVLGRGRTPKFRKVHLLGVKPAVDQ